jgi:hypothetical protein
MGAYFMNMNLALMGLPLDERATEQGFEVAERLGFTDLRVYHLFSQIVRASFIGDGSAFQSPFTEMNDLMRKLGHPRLPERNLAIYTPPYYLERGDLELARAVVERGERLVTLLPGDRRARGSGVQARAGPTGSSRLTRRPRPGSPGLSVSRTGWPIARAMMIARTTARPPKVVICGPRSPLHPLRWYPAASAATEGR